MEIVLLLEDYRNLLHAMEVERRKIEWQLLQSTVEPEKKTDQTILKNRKFELQILGYSLQQYAQYQEEENVIWIQLSKQNHHRLLGFLLSRLGEGEI